MNPNLLSALKFHLDGLLEVVMGAYKRKMLQQNFDICFDYLKFSNEYSNEYIFQNVNNSVWYKSIIYDMYLYHYNTTLIFNNILISESYFNINIMGVVDKTVLFINNRVVSDPEREGDQYFKDTLKSLLFDIIRSYNRPEYHQIFKEDNTNIKYKYILIDNPHYNSKFRNEFFNDLKKEELCN